MRHYWQALSMAFVLSAALNAQTNPPPSSTPTLDPRDRLDALLIQWEAKMKSIDSLSAKVVRAKTDRTFRSTEVFEGSAQYMKPNLAMIDLHRRKDRPDSPDIIEKFIFTGTYAYEFNQANKEVRYHELPPAKPGQVADDNFLSFTLGMKAEDAKGRYGLRLMVEREEKDKYYHYIEITSRRPQDKAEFTTAVLILTRDTLLPRALVFDEPNGNRIHWDIPTIQTGARLDRKEFEKPTVPVGWKLVRAPAVNQGQNGVKELAPRVVRPKP